MLGESKVSDSLSGQLIDDRYEVDDILGQGTAGVVYRAKDLVDSRMVALKVLHPHYTPGSVIERRLLREAELVSELKHTNVVELLLTGRVPGGTAYLVMELLQGESLRACLDRKGRSSFSEVHLVAEGVLSALVAAQRKGITHRDIKPENIFLANVKHKTRVKVLDFGAAKRTEPEVKPSGRRTPKLTVSNEILGTPHYMALEQVIASSDVDTRADIWSLGVVLYEMVAGELPFDAPSVIGLLGQLTTQVPRGLRELRPDTPPQLEAVVRRALAKDPDERFATPCEMRTALRGR